MRNPNRQDSEDADGFGAKWMMFIRCEWGVGVFLVVLSTFTWEHVNDGVRKVQGGWVMTR